MANLIIWTTGRPFLRQTGPHQIAKWLTVHGYTVKVIDFSSVISHEELINITLKHIGPDTIGIGVSTTFWFEHQTHDGTAYEFRYLTRRNYVEKPTDLVFHEPRWVIEARTSIQSKFPNLKWVLGGTNTAYGIRINKFEWVKISDNPENSILKFMDENSNKYVLRNQFEIQNLLACYGDDLGIQSYEVLPIELSRGCQFRCTFCSFEHIGKKKGTYIRDLKLVEQEFIENYNKFGTTRYLFADDTFNETEEKINNLADIAQRLPFKLEWVGYNRLDLIGSKPHTIQTLKDAGLRSSFFGIESLHPSASKLVAKAWNGKYARDFLLELKEKWGEDISWHLAFIVGLGEESSEHLDEIVDWLIDNNMYAWYFTPLHIGKTSDKTNKSNSLFAMHYEDYGYRFKSQEFHLWESDYWTREAAVIKSQELALKGRPHQQIAGYGLAEFATFGYTFDELMKQKSMMDFSISASDEIRKKIDTFLSNYIKIQLEQ